MFFNLKCAYCGESAETFGQNTVLCCAECNAVLQKAKMPTNYAAFAHLLALYSYRWRKVLKYQVLGKYDIEELEGNLLTFALTKKAEKEKAERRINHIKNCLQEILDTTGV